MTSVLHTWGSAMTHHPHIHMIVPGGGLSPDGTKWVACRHGFFLHVRVLSWLFRRLFLEGLMDLQRTGQLVFFGDLERLAQADAFTVWLAPFRKSEWVVYAKPPFGGPEAFLAYLSRYTHRVAISNAHLVSADAQSVAFRWKDYRIKSGDRQKVMQMATPEFIRRFLIHVLPDGFHRIRHYGLLASATRKANIRTIRALVCVERPDQTPASGPNAEIIPLTLREPCPCCGGPMRIIEIFRRGQKPMSRATTGAGRMTLRLSDATERHWLHRADPVASGCDHLSSARYTTAITPNRSAVPGASNVLAPVSGVMRTFSRTSDSAVASTVWALSP
jgi:hypothetical protein